MNKIEVKFEIVKNSDTEYDLIIFASENVLKSFASIYEKIFYIEKSKFQKPIVVVPAFKSMEHCQFFASYWKEVCDDLEKACKTCPTVAQFVDFVRTGEKV